MRTAPGPGGLGALGVVAGGWAVERQYARRIATRPAVGGHCSRAGRQPCGAVEHGEMRCPRLSPGLKAFARHVAASAIPRGHRKRTRHEHACRKNPTAGQQPAELDLLYLSCARGPGERRDLDGTGQLGRLRVRAVGDTDLTRFQSAQKASPFFHQTIPRAMFRQTARGRSTAGAQTYGGALGLPTDVGFAAWLAGCLRQWLEARGLPAPWPELIFNLLAGWFVSPFLMLCTVGSA